MDKEGWQQKSLLHTCYIIPLTRAGSYTHPYNQQLAGRKGLSMTHLLQQETPPGTEHMTPQQNWGFLK